MVTVGSFFGWISAFGGAWKDAPIEGFETFKFFRSPAVAASWAFVVSLFTASWTAIAIAAEGFTVAAIETYKTFVFPNKPRGKLAGKPIHSRAPRAPPPLPPALLRHLGARRRAPRLGLAARAG